jgi:RHS repeat-associated protein
MTKYWIDRSGNTQVTTYIYDVENLRVGKTENVNAPGTIMDVLKHFTYDGQNILSDGTAFYLNNIGVNTYEGEIYGDRNVAYLKDAVGTVRGELYDHPIVNKLTGAAFNYKSHSYTAFGEQMGLITNDGGADDVKDGVSFQGSYFDSESNLYYSRARYLMPQQGRWLTRDSFEDFSPAGLNKYQDCNNNPVAFTDPLGMDPTDSNSSDNIFTTIGNIFGNMISGVIGFAVGVGEGIVGAGVSLVGGITGNQSIIEAGRNILADAQKNISYSLYLAQNLSSSYQQNEQNYMIKYHTLPAGIIAGINENRTKGLAIKPYEQSIYNEAMNNPGSNIGFNSKGLLYTHTMEEMMNNPENMIAYNGVGDDAVAEDGMTASERMLRRLTANGSDLDYSNLSPDERIKKTWEKSLEKMDQEKLGESLKEQLKNYTELNIGGTNYYVAKVGGIEIMMSSDDLAAAVGENDNGPWTGNTPVNKAIDGLNGKDLIVLVDLARKNNLSMVQLSSMYRNSATLGTSEPHHSGAGFDITKVWKDGTKYDLNQNSDLVRKLRNDLYNDPRVSEVLDPSKISSKINNYDYANDLSAIDKHGIPISSPQSELYGYYLLMVMHETHIHVTVNLNPVIWR